MSSSYKAHHDHHEIWIMNGVSKMTPEIRAWLDEFAGKKWLGSMGAGSMNGNRVGMMHNFSCKETAMLFKLTWG